MNRSLLFCPNQTALLKCFQVKSHGLENNALDLISPPVHAALLSLLEKCTWCVAQFSWRKAFGLKAGSSLVTAFIPKHTAETTRAAANALQATAQRTWSLWKLTSFTSRKHAGAGKLQQANETQKTFLPFTQQSGPLTEVEEDQLRLNSRTKFDEKRNGYVHSQQPDYQPPQPEP